MKLYSILIPMFLLLSTIFTACSSATNTVDQSKAAPEAIVSEESSTEPASNEDASEESTTEAVSANTESAQADEYFTERDLDASYEADTHITLSDGASTADGAGVQIDGDTILISKEGTYVLSGTLSNGQIIIDTTETAKIQLVLDNASVTCENSAALYIKSADKVFLTLAAGTGNTLSSTGTFTDDKIDAAIYAKEDLTINGDGTLTLTCETGHGIAAKDDLKITAGSLSITAAGKGLDVNDSVRIAAGTLDITSGKDAIQIENTDDASQGWFYMSGGTVNLSAEAGDGIDASGQVTILDGALSILSGGGYENSTQKNNGSTDDETSLKGIKSDVGILIQNGTFRINTADDALHTDGDLTLENGAFMIAAGDDALHAEQALTIQDGEIEILSCHEGLEGYKITIAGGNTTLNADDDGVNAAGSGSPTLTISGGTLYVDASGDGLDSNGSMYITGGVVIVDGPVNEGNAALDYDGQAVITGGQLIAVGPSGMALNLSAAEGQGSILYNVGLVSAGTTITLTDSSGKEILSYTPQKDFSSLVLSDPAIQVGSTYTLTIGQTSVEIEMTEALYGQGGMMGGMGGMQGPKVR
ncbi:MAG: carbohydrate-binding domain-containing protein [Clostridiales bacterium]|nr:carbohydrate-binding domain-containing protein [Clostridiales bacterium]